MESIATAQGNRSRTGSFSTAATRYLTHACIEFEQLGAQSFRLYRSKSRSQLPEEDLDEVVSEAVRQEERDISYVPTRTEPVGIEAVLEFLNAVFVSLAIVVKPEDQSAVV